jgi:hypothetical protein
MDLWMALSELNDDATGFTWSNSGQAAASLPAAPTALAVRKSKSLRFGASIVVALANSTPQTQFREARRSGPSRIQSRPFADDWPTDHVAGRNRRRTHGPRWRGRHSTRLFASILLVVHSPKRRSTHPVVF